MSDLIDTPEMYLRTILELQEEQVAVLRARLGERLGHSTPTVSQTVARLERDGLVQLETDRHIELTPAGYELAVAVLRKHRLAECLLVDVLGMDLRQAHDEACRWEHVMSAEAERKVATLLDFPQRSPYGNAIPGLSQLLVGQSASMGDTGIPTGQSLSALVGRVPASGGSVVVHRIAEVVQTPEVLAVLSYVGAWPGSTVQVRPGTVAKAALAGEAADADWRDLPDPAADYIEATSAN